MFEQEQTLFEDWLYLAIDPRETSFEDGYLVNKAMQEYAHETIDPTTTMDKLESLGVKEPHLLIANQFEIMETALSRCS